MNDIRAPRWRSIAASRSIAPASRRLALQRQGDAVRDAEHRDVDLKPGGAMSWSGPGKDGKPTRYVTGKVLRVEAPNLLEYKFAMGEGTVMSRVRVELAPETEAVKVVVTNDEWADDDPAYTQNADGWPRILSRLKTLLETGKTFRPH
jgi:uncharacterized protein YndB with AHSA1/START domain